MIAVDPDLDAHGLLERADHALYEAKRNKRGEPVVFDEAHEAALTSETRIVECLRQADIEREFTLEYQPQVDCVTGEMTGFEALARWDSPELGRVGPSVFVPAAERASLIRTITAPLLKKALAAMSQWPEPLTLSFNLSGQELIAEGAISTVIDILKTHAGDSSRVIFEVRENALHLDQEKSRAALQRLAGAGARIAIDDFGRGASNVAALSALPVSRIKIDRQYTAALLSDQSARRIIKTLASLARSLDLECVIEGVETQAQLDALRAGGVRHVQGYLFCRPLPAMRVPALIETGLSWQAEPEERMTG